MHRAVTLFPVVFGVVCCVLDLLSKHVSLVRGYGVINTGISFGLFADVPWQVVIAFFLFVLIRIWGNSKGKNRWVVTLVLAGSMGNFFSRLLWGGIVDWLPLPFGGKNNLADWYIALGLLWWVLIQYRGESISAKPLV